MVWRAASHDVPAIGYVADRRPSPGKDPQCRLLGHTYLNR